jgi:phosphomannomutase
MKARMVQEGAVFGGEVTGHYYFRDFFSADSGIVPALLVLEMLSARGCRLSELLAPLEKEYCISGEINSTVDDPAGKIEQLAARYGRGQVSRMDGFSSDFGDWHFNVRASNTEPLLRLNLEARKPQLMASKRDEVLELIRS